MHSVALTPDWPTESTVSPGLCDAIAPVGHAVCVGGAAAAMNVTVMLGGAVSSQLSCAIGQVMACDGDVVILPVPALSLVLLRVAISHSLSKAGGGRGLGRRARLLLVVHEGLLVRPRHRADDLLLPAVRRAGGGRTGGGVHGDRGLGVGAGLRGAHGRGGGRAGGGVLGGGLAEVGRGQGGGELAVQLAVVHHVVHGTLHLHQHPLLLPLRDTAKTDR